MLGDSAEGGTVQRWLCARREGSRALPRAKPRTGALFAAAQGGYAARGGGAGVASHPESTSGAGGGGGGTLDGGATGFAICAATGAATGWCSAGTCGADTAALGAGSAAGASSSGVSQSPSRSSLPTATGVPGKASGTSSRFSAARPVESRAPAAFPVPPSSRAWEPRWKGRWTGTPSPGAIKISSPSSSRPSSSSTSARADPPTARSSGRRGRVRLSPPRFVTATRRRTPRVDGFSTSARTSATCSTLARTHGGSSLLCSYQNAAARRTRAPLRARAPSRRKASSPPRSSPPRTPLAFRIRQDAPALRSLRPSHRRQRQLRRAGWQMRRDFRPSASRDTQPPAPMRKARRCDEATSHSELSACRRGGVWETPTSSVPGGSPASKLATVVESPACGLE